MPYLESALNSKVHGLSFFSGGGGLDIGAQMAGIKVLTSLDFEKDAIETLKMNPFFAHTVHGHTAAELIVERANAQKEHMGMTTWENAPDGKIVKPDVSVAKNYLKQVELEDMGRLVNGVLDFAERMANRHMPMTMEDWAKRIDIILEASGDAVLQDAEKYRQSLPRISQNQNLKNIV